MKQTHRKIPAYTGLMLTAELSRKRLQRTTRATKNGGHTRSVFSGWARTGRP